MQVNLDYGGHQILRFVNNIGSSIRPVWLVIIGVAVVLFVLFITKRRK